MGLGHDVSIWKVAVSSKFGGDGVQVEVRVVSWEGVSGATTIYHSVIRRVEIVDR